MAKTATDNGTVTLTQEQLTKLLQETREAAIQAVVQATAEPEPEPLKVVDLSDPIKVAKDLAASEGLKPKDPSAPITFPQRKAVIRYAEKGAVQWEALNRWTMGQASAAIEALKGGYGVKVGRFHILPRA